MFRVELKNWEEAREIAGPLRWSIFVGEQNVPEGIELDDLDVQCTHALAYTPDNKFVGTGRLLPDGRIGRMAVAKEWRRQGVGAALLEALIAEAKKRGHKEVTVSAQLQAAEFYRGFGFEAEGKVYKDAGILHQKMHKKI